MRRTDRWPLCLTASPNPFAESPTISLAGGRVPTGPAQFDLFDADGRCVRSLRAQSLREPVSLAARDAGGAPLPAGVYLLRARTGGVEGVTKLIVR